MTRRKKFRNQIAARTRISQHAIWEKMWATIRQRSEERRKAEPELVLAHKQCSDNRVAISQSSLCACFYCRKTFPGEAIQAWWDQPDDAVNGEEAFGMTAVCPFCGIDSVLGDQCGYELSEEFLRRMEQFWFGEGLAELCYATRGGSWQSGQRRFK